MIRETHARAARDAKVQNNANTQSTGCPPHMSYSFHADCTAGGASKYPETHTPHGQRAQKCTCAARTHSASVTAPPCSQRDGCLSVNSVSRYCAPAEAPTSENRHGAVSRGEKHVGRAMCVAPPALPTRQCVNHEPRPHNQQHTRARVARTRAATYC